MSEAEVPTNDEALTILIVDDSAMMRTMIKRVTGLADVAVAQILEAANGAEALKVLETQHVDVMFTDINMPVMSGPELLRSIQSLGKWPELLCCVISTDGSDARRAEVAALGATVYLEKPFRPEVMRDVLSQVHTRVAAR